MNDLSDQQEIAEITKLRLCWGRHSAALRAELVAAGTGASGTGLPRNAGVQLRETNEQLVLTAMRAQEIANAARSTLDERSHPPSLRCGPGQVPNRPDVRDLHEANSRCLPPCRPRSMRWPCQ